MSRPLPRIRRSGRARALAEDVGSGDLTAALVPGGRTRGRRVARERRRLRHGLVGRSLPPARSRVRVAWEVADGDASPPDERLCRMTGPARPILTGERTALNFLQTLSGTATARARYADAMRERAAASSTRARRSRACARRRSTPCAAAAATIIASGSTTASSSRRTTSSPRAASPQPWRGTRAGAQRPGRGRGRESRRGARGARRGRRHPAARRLLARGHARGRRAARAARTARLEASGGIDLERCARWRRRA